MSRAQIFLAGLIVGALIATALFWFQGPPLDVRQTVDSTRTDVQLFDSALVAHQREDARTRGLLDQSAALRLTAARAADSLDALSDRLRDSLDSVQADADSIRVLAQRLDDARRNVADSLRVVIQTYQRDSVLLVGRIVAADSLLIVAQVSLHAALGRLERVAAKVRPRCGLAVFGGLGFRGLDAGAGVACRL